MVPWVALQYVIVVFPDHTHFFVFSEFSLPNNDSNEERKMSPCPLFTVYLKKLDKGLGLGLIDGLVSYFCLIHTVQNYGYTL